MPNEGDVVISVSSSLIATIMRDYFNDVMFKQAVEIVDLKPMQDGYAFSLNLLSEKRLRKVQEERVRDNKGRYIPKEVKDAVA